MKKLSILLLAALLASTFATLAAARSHIEKTLKLEPNGRFALESDVGSVTLTGKSSSGAHVVIDADREDFESRYTINFEENAGSVSVTVRRKDRFSWNEHGSVHFEIEVPSQTQTDVRTGGGSVTLSNLRGESELKTSGGSIDVSGLNGKLDARTSGGSIHLREVTGIRERIRPEAGLRLTPSTVRSPRTPAAGRFTSIASPAMSRPKPPAAPFT